MTESLSRPIISIGIPCRNEGLWIYNTLRSIRATRTDKTPPLEVIVIDDASIDNGCAKLEEDFADLNCIVLTNGADDKHGTAVSKQRALMHARGEVFIALDGHMVFPVGWLDKMYAAYLANPNSFFYAASTEMHAAEVIYKKELGATSDVDLIKREIDLARSQYSDRPVYLLKDFVEGDGIQDQNDFMKVFEVPVLLDSFKLIKRGDLPAWTVCVCGDKIDETQPMRMTNYIAMLDYPEASAMIHPVWTDWYNVLNPPKRDLIEVNGIYGACYLFPRDLMLDKFGGWLPLEGWVTEENWISIAAAMTGIKIYCMANIISGHLYARPPIQTSGLNLRNQNLNSLAIIEICFDEYKVRIQKQCFGQTFKAADFAAIKELIETRKAKMRKNKIMTDNEFLQRTGMIIYFDEAHKQNIKQRIGTSEFGVKNMGSDGVKHILDDLQENPQVDWVFALVSMADRDKCTFRYYSLLECNEWNWQKNCRDRTAAGHSPAKRREMCGAVHETLQGFEAVHFWRERLGIDIKVDHVLTTQLANYLHKKDGFKLDPKEVGNESDSENMTQHKDETQKQERKK